MRRRTMETSRTTAIAALALVLVACATRTERIPAPAAAPGVAPALVVERFLRAANAKDYMTMARLFGTRDGSILGRDPRAEVEKRMFALASVLRHDDYAIEDELIAPGRTGEAVRIVVRLDIGERRIPVTFTVVRTEGAGWLVEQFDIEQITAGP
ncbi:MAG TPA: hypothetical protein VF158_11995 [Longimicrobiales bacterium]